MERLTPAQQIEQERAALQWAQQIKQDQPADLCRAYEASAAEIVRALTGETYRFSIQLPHVLYQNGQTVSVSARWLLVRVGNPIDVLLRRSCNGAILKTLNHLNHHTLPTVAQMARFVAYLAAKQILFDLIPPVAQIEQTYRRFDLPLKDASVTRHNVGQLVRYMAWMRLVEQLFPAWAGDDVYDEKQARLIADLTAQGRALATYETEQMIAELLALWKGGDPLRGLTLSIPYLDERQYRMNDYKVVVIPAGRIPFRPEFVVGACRVEQQSVRKNPQLSQSTRWQLISQLDSVVQAFERAITDMR